MPARIDGTARRERLLLSVAFSFVLCGAIALALTSPEQPAQPLLLVTLPFLFSFALLHAALNRCSPNRDPCLLPLCALLTGFGLVSIARLAPAFLPRQAAWVVIAALASVPALRLSKELRWLRRFRYTWLLGGLALLATTLVVGVNPSGYGPRLWLGFWGIYFQPSELLKLLMVVFLASYLAEKRELIVSNAHTIGRIRLPSLAYVGPLFVMFGLAIVLLAWQQDLGAAMLFFFTFLAMLYVATADKRYVFLGLLLFAVLGVAAYSLSARVELRVDAWLNPWPEATGRSYQIVQSLYAFGAGGVFGQGLALGYPTYIPAVHTDFIFAAVAEELGLVGALAIVALYGLLLWRGLSAAARAARPFPCFLAAGLTAGLVIQAWVIMAGNAKLTPIAGVTLPFVSYGGSSLLLSFITLAFLLRVSASESERPASTEIVCAARPTIRDLAACLGVALLMLGITCAYWAVGRADYLAQREDNPRRVLYEARIVRGHILDRSGYALAATDVLEDDTAVRLYPVPGAGPAVGYASLRYGTAGIEAAFDEHLRGEQVRTAWEAAWDALLHTPPQGDDIQLTVSAPLQTRAQHLLAGHPGAVVLLDASTGDILVLASSPTFDPARLDEQWEELRDDPAAPLLNRAVGGLYQPGSALQTIVLAEALAREAASPEDEVTDAGLEISIDGAALGCVAALSEPETLEGAYRAACPAPFVYLGQALGANALATAFDRWLLTEAPVLRIPSEAAEWDVGTITTTESLEQEAMGQGELTVSPLRMALVAAAIGNRGEMPAPRLAFRLQDHEGSWEDLAAQGEPKQVIPPDLAQSLLDAWERHSDDVAGHLAQAVSGEDREPHAWFLGLAPADEPGYAVAVLLEEAPDAAAAAGLAVELLEAAIASKELE
jgi:cell division protein FtsW (lipid II flippase)/cell division protein FtsI/penicillin-binding protein 2